MALNAFRQRVANWIAPSNSLQTETSSEAEKTSENVTINMNPTMQELHRFFNSDIGNIGSNLNCATYYACMLIRCNAFAKLPMSIMRYTKDKGSVVCTEHPLYDLLHLRPNPNMSAFHFKWATEFMKLDNGNAYWFYIFKGGRITKLKLLDSDRMRIFVDDMGIVGPQDEVYYRYQDPKQGELIYHSSQICHFKNFATDGITGHSIKHHLYSTIASEQYAQNVIDDKYKSGMQDPIIVEYSGDFNDAKKEKIIAKFKAMGGPQNAGKVVPIPSDFKVTQLETKLVNAQFFELQGLTTRRIANAFGVKNFQLNDMEKSTYNNVESQNRAFYSDTLQCEIVAYEQEIDYKLIPEFQRKEGLYSHVNVDALLRSDILTRYQAYQIGINTGFEKISEVREHENLPFVEGTDRLIINNGAAVPLEQLGIQYTS